MSSNHLTPANSIIAFYAGKSIFVTGGTGFMGKVLVEKLLRSCDVREIFLLIRPKKGLTVEERLNKILSSKFFDRLKKEKPNEIEKIIPVSGDCSVEGLGISAVERHILTERVSVMFHVAASVRFDDSLKEAVFMNLRSTRDICILGTAMKNLMVFVHVSSTYTQADKPEVEEQMYPGIGDWKKVIKVAENVDDHVLRTLTAKYLNGWPNTYTFTKRLSEQVIADYAGVLPTVVFRPSIVVSTINEPVSGWLDNFNGPVGMMVGAGKGILRVMHVNPTVSSDFIPVDVAIKAMISSSWKRGIISITKDPEIHVYNCSSSDVKSITTAEIVSMGLHLTTDVPLENIMWYPDTMVTSNKTLFYVLMLVLHLLPAVTIDGILKLSGRKPMLVKLHRKIYTANSSLEYFLTNEWKFHNKNLLKLLVDLPPTDLETFGYAYYTFDIYEYFTNCLYGAKTYLLNEDINNLPEARKHFARMYWIDRMLKVWLAVVIATIIYRFNIMSRVTAVLHTWFDESFY